MLQLKKFAFGWLLAVAAALLLSGCNEEIRQEVNTDPVAFHSGDECHVCGMLITEWPGSKGQSVNTQNGERQKFCSTVDMFSWLLQPENRTLQAKIYVHDMSKTHWDAPEDEHLIDARSAWFVHGSKLLGAMGPSLAAFSERAAADQLVQEQGGRVLSFDEVTLEVLQEISRAGHEHAADMGEQMQHQMRGDGHAMPAGDAGHGEDEHADPAAAAEHTDHAEEQSHLEHEGH